jgi:selenide,water dikinase
VDFFTPIVDDPRTFGRAAAANSLSDVYAMGGRPLTALNIVCFPMKKLGIEPLRDILGGGMEILREAGAVLVGGHSVEDDEPKYGLAVTGIVHPDRIMTNSGLRPGDTLILTKKIGTGILAAAIKGGLAPQDQIDEMVRSMCTLNRAASEAAASFSIKGCTDITGFGLAGHMVEMAVASRCRVRINSQWVPTLDGALEWAAMGLVPGGAHANRKHFGVWMDISNEIPLERTDLLFDPQTSGGLVLAAKGDIVSDLLGLLNEKGVQAAAVIGEVLDYHPVGHVEIV